MVKKVLNKRTIAAATAGGGTVTKRYEKMAKERRKVICGDAFAAKRRTV